MDKKTDSYDSFLFSFGVLILWIVLVSAVGTATLRAEVEMSLAVDRTTLYEGESILYQIVLSGSDSIADSVSPDMAAYGDFNVQMLRKQIIAPSHSATVSIVNGKMMRQESTTPGGVAFSYILSPKRAGSFSIPPPRVNVDGKFLGPKLIKIGGREVSVDRGGEIPLTVHAPDSQDLAFLEIVPNRTRLYPFQPLTITLIIQIKGLPGDLASRDPLSVLRDPPRLSIPWALDDSALPKGMLPQHNLDQWFSVFHVRRTPGGFAINERGDNRLSLGFDDDFFSSPFSSRRGGFRRILSQFAPKPAVVKRNDAQGRETDYWEYRFSRTFIPEEIGKFSFGPVTLKGAFAEARPDAAQGIDGREIFAVAPAVNVEIIDVPEENRPHGYIGAFGKFDWSVDLQPRKAKVGEPLTLTLRLTGQGSTANVTPPDLSAYPEVAENFKTYPPTEDVNDRSCIFTYTVRPTKAGKVVFPSIPVAFFDVEKEEFRTLNSEAITLDVAVAETLQSGPVYGGRRRSSTDDLERSDQGLFANMTAPGGAVDQTVDMFRWLQIMIGLVVVYIGAALTTLVWRRRNSDPRRLRRRGAAARASRRLGVVLQKLKTDKKSTSEELVELSNSLQSVFFGFTADLTDGVEQGMTTKDACQKLLDLGVDETTVDGVRQLLETLDGARYGGLDLRSLDQHAEDADRLLKTIKLQSPKSRG